MNGKERWDICYYGFSPEKGGQIEKNLNNLELSGVYCCYKGDIVGSGKYTIFWGRAPDGVERNIAKLHEITIKDQTEKKAGTLGEEVEKSLRICEECACTRTKPGY